MALVAYPSIMNSLKTRSLENEAREIQSIFHTAKFQAVKSKLYHRVKFEWIGEDMGADHKFEKWSYYIEREDTPDVWNQVPGFAKYVIEGNIDVVVDLPNDTVVFSPLGFVSNFKAAQNYISLQSNRLQNQGQPDERVISVLAGGSIKYIKKNSE